MGFGLVAGSGAYGPITPQRVYSETRPTDWFTMPTPSTNEVYLLYLIPPTDQALFAINVTCTGNYTVALGTVVNGSFSQVSSTSVASGTTYETEFDATDWSNTTSDGFKQVMIKINGTAITTITFANHSYVPLGGKYMPVVEFRGNLPSVGALGVNYNDLRYFSLEGTNSLTSTMVMFSTAVSLVAVLQLDTSAVTNMQGMFSYCVSLTAVPLFNTSLVTNMSGMFAFCTHIREVPLFNTSNVTTMEAMFMYCYSLEEVPLFDTSSVLNMKQIFSYCFSLTTIPLFNTSAVTNMNQFANDTSLRTLPAVDTSSVTDMEGMLSNDSSLLSLPMIDTASVASIVNTFINCTALTHITFNPAATWATPQDIFLASCSLSHDAIVDLFNSLPTIGTAKTLTLAGNFGVSSLTDPEKAIATGKGWTLAL